MKRAIREYGFYSALIVVFASLAIGTAAYVVVHQRLPLPFQDRYTIKVELPYSNGLVPGLGEPANVAGVQVGQISAVDLVRGRALVSLTIDPSRLKRVYSNWTATLYPNTPLSDMQINLAPGPGFGVPLKPGDTIPLNQTAVPQHPDDFFNALDADSRAYLTALINEFGAGVDGHGKDLNMLFQALTPTTQQIRELSGAFAARQAELARVIHNFAVISKATASKDAEFAQLVVAGDKSLAALAGQDQQLSQSFALFPSTLALVRQNLTDASNLSYHLIPTLNALQTPLTKLPANLALAGGLAAQAKPFLSQDLNSFVTNGVPVFNQLLPATRNLIQSTPDFTNVVQVFQYFFNELLYNKGDSSKTNAYWLGWFTHNINSSLSTGDSYGSALRSVVRVPCTVFNPGDPNYNANFRDLLGLIVNASKCP